MGVRLSRKRSKTISNPAPSEDVQKKNASKENELPEEKVSESPKKIYHPVFEYQSPISSAATTSKNVKGSLNLAGGLFKRSTKKNSTVSFSVNRTPGEFQVEVPRGSKKLSIEENPKRKVSELWLKRKMRESARTEGSVSSQGEIPDSQSVEFGDSPYFSNTNPASRGERMKSLFSRSSNRKTSSNIPSSSTFGISVETQSVCNTENTPKYATRNERIMSEETFIAKKGEFNVASQAKPMRKSVHEYLSQISKASEKKNKNEGSDNKLYNKKKTSNFAQYLEELKAKSKVEGLDKLMPVMKVEEKKNQNTKSTPGKAEKQAESFSRISDLRADNSSNIKLVAHQVDKQRRKGMSEDGDLFKMKSKMTNEYIKAQHQHSEESLIKNFEFDFYEQREKQLKENPSKENEKVKFERKKRPKNATQIQTKLIANQEKAKASNEMRFKSFSEFEVRDPERLNNLVWGNSLKGLDAGESEMRFKDSQEKDSALRGEKEFRLKEAASKQKKAKVEFLPDAAKNEYSSEELLAVLLSNKINPTNYFLGDKTLILKSITSKPDTPQSKKGSIACPSYMTTRREKQKAVLQIQEPKFFKVSHESKGTEMNFSSRRKKFPLLKIDTLVQEPLGDEVSESILPDDFGGYSKTKSHSQHTCAREISEFEQHCIKYERKDLMTEPNVGPDSAKYIEYYSPASGALKKQEDPLRKEVLVKHKKQNRKIIILE